MPHLWQLFRRILNYRKENTRYEATRWCEQLAVSKEKALKELGVRYPLRHPAADFPDLWEWAEQKSKEVPVRMGGAGSVDFLYTLMLALKPARILETGVAYGWSTLAILLGISYNNRGMLVSVDMPYPRMGNEPYVGCVIHPSLRRLWTLIRKPDVTGVPLALKILGGIVDLFHYDSDKSYTGRMTTYPIVWRALRPGGIFISDDVGDNIAFKEFAEIAGVKPLIFREGGKFVGVLRKPAS